MLFKKWLPLNVLIYDQILYQFWKLMKWDKIYWGDMVYEGGFAQGMTELPGILWKCRYRAISMPD